MDISLYFRDKEREREERADVDMIAETLLVLPYTSRKEGGGEKQTGRREYENKQTNKEDEEEQKQDEKENMVLDVISRHFFTNLTCS